MNIPKLLLQFLAEIVGTFIFIILIFIITSKESSSHIVAIPIGLALAISILIFGDFTGGHFNPAISFAFFIKDPQIFTGAMLAVYCLAQMIGGLTALEFYNYIKLKNII
jgi:glycerol uptake facilitator-like aquaporin